MKYSIVIPTYNNYQVLVNCINSIVKNSDMSQTEIIVVSNGCKDATWNFIRKHPHIKPIRFYDPIGFPKAVNVGIQQAEGDYVILLNNDCVILDFQSPNWLDMLCSPFTRPNSKVAVTGVSRLAFVPTLKNTIPPQQASSMENEKFILFFCAMIPQTLVHKLGLLDEAFTPGIGEDVDFCLRAQQQGYTVELVPTDNDNWEYSTNHSPLLPHLPVRKRH